MPNYRTNDARFDVPDTWLDQTIVAFRLPPAPGGTDASFVVTRDPSKGDKPFGSYAEEQAAACRKALPGFQLIRSDALAVNDRAAWWLEFSWKKDAQPLQLRQIMFDCGYHAMICTLTCSPRDIGFHDGPWQGVMASMGFDRAEEPGVFQPHLPGRG